MPLFRRKVYQQLDTYPVVKSFKYLGITISSNGKINNHLE